MNKYIKINIIFFFSLVILSCNTHSLENKDNSFEKITPIEDYALKNQNCKYLFDGYFNRFGIAISNYYEIIDYVKFNDKDTVAIISPKILTPTAQECRVEDKEVINGRILIIQYDNETKVFYNVVSNNIGDGTSGCELIEERDNGFRLYKTLGQACTLKYCIDIDINDKEPVISKISIEYTCRDEQYKSEFIFDESQFLLVDYKRDKTIDSLLNTMIPLE